MSHSYDPDDIFLLVEQTLENTERIVDIVTEVLDYLGNNELEIIPDEKKDELQAKLQTALTILYSMDESMNDFYPQQTYTKIWINNTNQLLDYMNQTTGNGSSLLC